MPGWIRPLSQAPIAVVQKVLYADPNNCQDLIAGWYNSNSSAYYECTDAVVNGQINPSATFTLIPISLRSGTNNSYYPWGAGAFWDSNNSNNIYFADDYGLYYTTNGGTNWNFSSRRADPKLHGRIL